jgi:hypothetical protein
MLTKAEFCEQSTLVDFLEDPAPRVLETSKAVSLKVE